MADQDENAVSGAAWAPRRMFHIGPYQFSRYRREHYNGHRRWECSAHGRGVGNCWTPVDAFFSLRRWERSIANG